MLDLLKILEKDSDSSFTKDQSFDKFDWNFNEKCLYLFKNFLPNSEKIEYETSCLPSSRLIHNSTKKTLKEPKSDLKTIIEENEANVETIREVKNNINKNV